MEVTKLAKFKQKGAYISMLQQNSLPEKYEQRFLQIFSTLKVGQILRSIGIRKAFGISAFQVFQLIFQLVFQGRNLYQILNSERGKSLPCKDVIYRFLNHPRYAWRRFLNAVSLQVIQHFEKLTSASRVHVFIIDDSVLQRNRSKKAELLARIHDHTIGRFVRGYNMLTLGWSDGYSFVPVDFSMLSSAKAENRHCEIGENLDKRTHGYKRRMEALLHKPEAVVNLINNAITAGFSADYVLMDSWFTQAPLLRSLLELKLHAIGMVKQLKQRYILGDERLSLPELYAKLPKKAKKGVFGSIVVNTTCGIPVKLVFVQNRNNRREWLAILSTDLSLEDSEIIRIYGIRWSIETFFKFTKSYLKLGSEFQGRSFDMLISHTTIVFCRYLILEWERRNSNDSRSFGGLFYLFCDEIRDIDFKTALQHLMLFILNFLNNKNQREKSSVICQLKEWMGHFPSYIKALFAELSCES